MGLQKLITDLDMRNGYNGEYRFEFVRVVEREDKGGV